MKKLLIALVLALASFTALGQTSPIVSNTCTASSITVTNASQSLIAANGLRRILMIQNNDTAGNVHFAFGTTAATTAMNKLVPGSNYYASGAGIPNQAVNLIGSIASNANVSVLECQ